MIDTIPYRRRMAEADDEQIAVLVHSVREALEGDSNDADHDALVDVAHFFDIDYTPTDTGEIT